MIFRKADNEPLQFRKISKDFETRGDNARFASDEDRWLICRRSNSSERRNEALPPLTRSHLSLPVTLRVILKMCEKVLGFVLRKTEKGRREKGKKGEE